MANRAPTVGRDDDALFLKDGLPVKFCFHRSVTQGRGKISRDVERHGGKIVQDERRANVLLVDEQEDIDFIRRRYYSSTELYRLSLYVEPRGFVQTCIRSGSYHHVGPAKQGMPGRTPSNGGGPKRVPFTEEDRDHLAYYLATRCPTKDGRMGNNAYKDLERLGQTDDPSWEWARRHTFHSWREHYKMNPVMMDARIDFYLERLKDVGHHFGHDPRRHDYRKMRMEEEEEEDDEEVEEEEPQAVERQDRERRERGQPAVAAAARAQYYLARQEQDLLSFDEEEDDAIQEAAIQEQQRVKRHRIHVQRQREVQETQAKRPRVAEASGDERRAPGVEIARGEKNPAPEREKDGDESQEIEGSDLFGDRAYEEESRFRYDDYQDFPAPFSPRASPVPEQDGPPLSTQATLVASPLISRNKSTSTLGPTPAKVTEPQEPQVTAAQPIVPRSQKTPAVIQERVVVPRQRVRGTSAQPGPSVPREKRTRDGIAAREVPLQGTRARSRSVDAQPMPVPVPEPQRARPPEDRVDKGKGKAKEEALTLIEEDEQVVGEPREEEIELVVTSGPSTREAFEDEMAVEGLLEESVASVGDEEDGDGDRAEAIVSDLSPSHVVDIGSEPTDSDDAETHLSLVRGAMGDGSASGHEPEPDPVEDQNQELGRASDEDSDSEDADRIERMANASLHVVPALTLSQPRVTRSQSRTQAQTQIYRQISPRRTRSGNQARKTAQPGLFPSPGTKARAVVDRLWEEKKGTPYAPPEGSRAAKAVRGKGRQR